MELGQFFNNEFDEHVTVAAETQKALYKPFEELVSAAVGCIQSGGKILLFGNGGSAADCQHLATELTIRYKVDRDPIAAIALTTDTSALTAGGNDIGFENIFGLCPSFRRSVESGIVKVQEHACATVIAALRASSYGIPSQPIAGLQGSDVPKMTGFDKISDPYTGEEIFMIPSITPDWAIIHVPYSDKFGNARIEGGVFEDILMTRASKQVILTTEKIKETSFFQENPMKTKIPSFLVRAVVQVEKGAFPMSCYPFYDYDEEVMKKYFLQSKSNNTIEEHLVSLENIDYA